MKILKSLTISILYFSTISLKPRIQKKIILEELKKNIFKIYNIEKLICFNDSKKTRNKVKKQHILENLLR